jgi:hypothetical protein
LGDAEQEDLGPAVVGGGFEEPPRQLLLVLPLGEVDDGDLLRLSVAVDLLHVRVPDLAECRR